MKRAQLNELRSLTEEELHDKVHTLKKELFELQFQRASGRVEKPHKFKSIRRDIARILTILKEKEKK